MIERLAFRVIKQLASEFKAVALTGPRQSGKTTLARTAFPDKPYVSLENPVQREFALTDPVGFLKQFPEGAILDEVQRAPDLFSFLQQILDEHAAKGRFILTGSNNFLLLETISQSLAGRVGYLDLLPFSLDETTRAAKVPLTLNDVLYTGGYPSVAYGGSNPKMWYDSYIRTYIERDVRQIKNITNLVLFQRLLYMCAGRIGQQLNLSSLANDVGLDYKTIQSWLGIMQASYVLYLLPPYHNNFNKRMVKSPKLYFYDSGLVCNLLGITDSQQLTLHPFRGPLVENFIISELLKNRFNKALRSNLFYFRDSAGNEMDVLLEGANRLIPVEIKSSETVNDGFFKNFRYWEKLTGTNEGILFYAGQSGYVRNGVTVKSWQSVVEV